MPLEKFLTIKQKKIKSFSNLTPEVKALKMHQTFLEIVKKSVKNLLKYFTIN